ncbi:SUKH-4 family immunity protein [Streptomyces sp. NPDC005951]|uniref:SUKH-4 family immunity protein n=1 Tax=Streptomyces sp. NPDC005951 TaxID=3154573 RepID=UPI0033CD47C1
MATKVREDLTADDVRSVSGLTGVVHFPRYDASHNRLSGRSVLLLVHRDAESLVYALSKFGAPLRKLKSDGEGAGERADALRGEISEFDPLPLADGGSPWNQVLESTRREIAYAHAAGKPVSFTGPVPPDHPISRRFLVRTGHSVKRTPERQAGALP